MVNAPGDRDAGQIGAVDERPKPDTVKTIGKFDALQSGAFLKGKLDDIGDAFTDGHVGEGISEGESSESDAVDVTGNGYINWRACEAGDCNGAIICGENQAVLGDTCARQEQHKDQKPPFHTA